MKLSGVCQNNITGFDCKSYIEFDLKEQTIAIFVPMSDLHEVFAQGADILKRKVKLPT